MPATDTADAAAINAAAVQGLNLNESTYALVKELAKYGEALTLAVKQNEPFVVTRCLNSICRAFNRFYTNTPILKAADAEKRVLLAVCRATVQVLANGMQMLGMDTVDRM